MPSPLTALLAALAASALPLASSESQSPISSGGGGRPRWHAPSHAGAGSLTEALGGRGVFGLVFDPAPAPSIAGGPPSWCNMARVRPGEYRRPAPEFKLRFVELVHRHHKRTPYASNAFPVEPYPWDCPDVRLFHYGQPARRPEPARVFRETLASPVNPFRPVGWTGSCAFPQITAQGLLDSWEHGVDLYQVYHGLLGLLPARDANFSSAVRYRVTNNDITSQVAAMIVSGMWQTTDPFPLIVQPQGVDSLEPQYSCPAASTRFTAITSKDNPQWQQHLEASADIFRSLDKISQVRPDDHNFHISFDHYYDNLSARQCHGKPLPCQPDDGFNHSACVTQELADAVYRMGNWEYNYMYRRHPASLEASAASLGVWIGELTTHLRDFMAGSTDVVYFHNVAHDGSLSRLLSILQLDEMFWPGMGAEVVFELYEREAGQTSQAKPDTFTAPECALNEAVCRPPRLNSQTALPQREKSQYYLRVLFGGRPFKSSSPVLGLMDMKPIETVLEYLDGLVGKAAELVGSKCREQPQ